MSSFFDSIGSAFSSIGRALGDVASFVGGAVKSVVQQSLPIIETAVLTSVGLPGPVAAGIVNYANGGNIQSAIAAGAGQY